jgi:hypothetical protein
MYYIAASTRFFCKKTVCDLERSAYLLQDITHSYVVRCTIFSSTLQRSKICIHLKCENNIHNSAKLYNFITTRIDGPLHHLYIEPTTSAIVAYYHTKAVSMDAKR